MRTGLLILVGLAVVLALFAAARFALAPKPFAASFTAVVPHGSSRAEAEQKIALPLEQALVGLDGLTSIRTHIDGQQVSVRGELKPGLPPDAIIAEALSRVSAAKLDGAPPEVTSERMPLQRTYLSLDSDRLSESALDDLAELEVRVSFLRLPGFRDVSVCGRGMTGTMITLEPERLSGSPHEVLERLRTFNVSLPAGVSKGEFVVRGTGSATLDQLRGLDLGHGQRLGDVATFTDQAIGPLCYAIRNGQRSAGLLLAYLPDADTEAIHAVPAKLPAGVRARPLRIDRVVTFATAAPAEVMERLLAAVLRPAPQVAEVAIEIRREGKGAVATAYVELSDPKASLSLRLPEGLQLVRIEGEPRRELTLAGPDGELVARTAERVERSLAALGQTASSRAPLIPEVRIELDRERLALLGLSPADVAETVQLATDDGVEALSVFSSTSTHRVHLRLPQTRDEDLAVLRVGKGVPLAEVAKLVRGEEPAWIDREDGLRVVRLQTSASAADVDAALKSIELPQGVVLRR